MLCRIHDIILLQIEHSQHIPTNSLQIPLHTTLTGVLSDNDSNSDSKTRTNKNPNPFIYDHENASVHQRLFPTTTASSLGPPIGNTL
jgi:hypothetical protein